MERPGEIAVAFCSWPRLAVSLSWHPSGSGNFHLPGIPGALGCSVIQKTVLRARLRRCVRRISIPPIRLFWLYRTIVCQQMRVGLGVPRKLGFPETFPHIPELFQELVMFEMLAPAWDIWHIPHQQWSETGFHNKPILIPPLLCSHALKWNKRPSN